MASFPWRILCQWEFWWIHFSLACWVNSSSHPNHAFTELANFFTCSMSVLSSLYYFKLFSITSIYMCQIRFPTWKKNEGNKITSYLCMWYPYLQEIIDGPQILWLQSLWVFVMHRHETPQIEIPSAHDNSVWDLAWHPIGYLLCRYDNLVAYFTYGIISSYWFQIWTLVFNLVYPRLFKLWTSGRINWVLNNHVIN